MALTSDESQAAALLDALGLPPDTDDPDLIIATVVDLAAQAASTEPAKPSEVAAAAKRHGMEVIDTATAEALRRDAAEGRRIAAAAAKARIESAVDNAINKGKITAARRKHWVTLIEADPAMERTLADIPNETAVPMTEIGHSVDASADDLAEAGHWFY